MIFFRNTLVAIILVMPSLTSAAGITNGNFNTGDYSSWSQDVDGWGAPVLGLNDFTIVEPTAGNSVARIEADYWSVPGDIFSTPNNEVFFANTLYQNADLTAAANQDLVLSFDWEFSGEDSLNDEAFFVVFGDGSGNYFGADGELGFLLEEDTYGSGSFSTLLDDSYLNLLGMTLEFQLASGFDGYGSFINIDNVSLQSVPQVGAVPVPAAIWLFASGLVGLIGLRHKNK